MGKPLVSQFRPHAVGLEAFFGPLEALLIDHLWGVPSATARDCFEQLRDSGRRISYGAVKTVLDRMVQKGYLTRVLLQRQAHYTTTRSRKQFIDQAVHVLVARLRSDYSAALDRALAAPVSAGDRASDPHQPPLPPAPPLSHAESLAYHERGAP
jgi:predicted transcriptional regulator